MIESLDDDLNSKAKPELYQIDSHARQIRGDHFSIPVFNQPTLSHLHKREPIFNTIKTHEEPVQQQKQNSAQKFEKSANI